MTDRQTVSTEDYAKLKAENEKLKQSNIELSNCLRMYGNEWHVESIRSCLERNQIKS